MRWYVVLFETVSQASDQRLLEELEQDFHEAFQSHDESLSEEVSFRSFPSVILSDLELLDFWWMEYD